MVSRINNLTDNTKNNIIKRLIGLPGDTIEIKNNTLYVNGEKLEENYIKEPMDTADLKITLKDNEYFLLGDNRNHSLDSRANGQVTRKQLIGKLVFKFK